VPVDLSRIERPAHERSQVPQNRCLAERIGGKAPTLALAVADHEAMLVHRSPEQRGGVASGGVAKLTPDQACREARAIFLQRRRA
jgi:hypothetical protein